VLRRDAAAAWRLAKELEARMLLQAKAQETNNSKYSAALAIGQRIETDSLAVPSGGGAAADDSESRRADHTVRVDLQIRTLEVGRCRLTL
jgi:hypothetical protein